VMQKGAMPSPSIIFIRWSKQHRAAGAVLHLVGRAV